MANFDPAFEKTAKAEEGYVNDPKDLSGEHYKGITRKSHPHWKGWTTLDLLKAKKNFPKNLDHDQELHSHLKTLFRKEYWDRISGDNINEQAIAESIFDFAVNAGPLTSIKMAQMTLGVEPNGIVGEATLNKINEEDARSFLAVFAIQKIRRYVSLCEKLPESKKLLLGWIKRTVEC